MLSRDAKEKMKKVKISDFGYPMTKLKKKELQY